MRQIEWPTLALTFFCYGLWALALLAIWPSYPGLALVIMALMSALHSSLVHENLHGHPTRNRRVNEALVALPLSLLYPYRRYKATHLAHHRDARLTDPLEDPESYYKARWMHDCMPRWFQRVLIVNNTMIGRMVLGPVLGAAGFLHQEARRAMAHDRGVRRAWLLHLAGLGPVLGVLWVAGMPFWLYLVAVVWPSLSLIAIRTFAEHRWHDLPEGRTIIVERSPLSWLFLNNNLHIVHHQQPKVPWYELPRLYMQRRDHWQALNRGYVFRNYWELFHAHAIVPKEPVVHPVLHQTPGPKRDDAHPPSAPITLTGRIA